MGQEGVREVQRQADALLASISEFFAHFGWPIALTLIVGWWAWTALQPHLREAANQRAIRHAQRKERTDVLDPDMRRIREKQAQQAAALAGGSGGGGKPGGKKTA